ncbi:universal stress protein [Chitinophaga nivalis]|uniref:Universal stress protein n=1 Tax=Chitinophaga nivalis TaxID=2991709 RepID=A0ABT3IEF1_9BACT|nr:universal stress protein [Chitinophaga nivalis]MCW3467981.1 universal stress protein [Chitinophaga nivalis]MCW3482328.1 universal stress protein [Chitinophaga nivalis]
MSEIMIAVDLSSFSESVISTGVELANKLQVPVTLLTVLELGIGLGLPEAGPIVVDDIPARTEEVTARLEVYKTRYPDTQIRIQTEVSTSSPANEILEQAHNGTTSILVVGTHGRTGLDHMLVGSNAEYIVRHARIPVLVVPYNQAAH